MRPLIAALALILVTVPAFAQDAAPEAAPAPAAAPVPAAEPAAPQATAEPPSSAAEDAPTPAPAPARKKKKAPPAPAQAAAPERAAPEAPVPAPAPKIEAPPLERDAEQLPAEKAVELAAREFFSELLAGNARSISEAAGIPFQLEDHRYSDQNALFEAWLHELRNKRTDLLVLYGIEILSPENMEKKYGKPPARLQSLPWRAPKTWIAVGNLSGHAAVALFRERGDGRFELVGYTD